MKIPINYQIFYYLNILNTITEVENCMITFDRTIVSRRRQTEHL